MNSPKLLYFFLFCFLSIPALAGIETLSENEFRKLAEELAPKVNLFAELWETDPKAEIYGGTSRDYLYWIKLQFKDAKTHEEAQSIVRGLRERPLIDVKEFINGESDADIITKKALSIDTGRFGLRKIDPLSPNILNHNTELGFNEVAQGFIPVEKIRVTKNGIFQDPLLGDGLKEIYTNRPTVHFPDPIAFSKSKYAKEGVNHQILLVLRYLRILTLDYTITHGKDYPNYSLLFSKIDDQTKNKIMSIVNQAIARKELVSFFAQPRFKSWFNGTIRKAFQTNPAVALMVAKDFGIEALANVYGSYNIEPLNQYVFAKQKNPAFIQTNLNKYSVNEKLFYSSVEANFPDHHISHGTRSDSAFRSIVYQGPLPSEDGLAGKGFYGVSLEREETAEAYAQGKERIVKLKVKKEAKIVDIRTGEGKRIWEDFSGKRGDEEHFADAFGIDIIKYDLQGKPAFVVKNSSALENAQGVYRQLLPFNELILKIRDIHDPNLLLNLMETNQLSNDEITILLRESPINEEALLEAYARWIDTKGKQARIKILSRRLWNKYLSQRFAQIQKPAELISFISSFNGINKISNYELSQLLPLSPIPEEDLMNEYARWLERKGTDAKLFKLSQDLWEKHTIRQARHSQSPEAILETLLEYGKYSNSELLAFFRAAPLKEEERIPFLSTLIKADFHKAESIFSKTEFWPKLATEVFATKDITIIGRFLRDIFYSVSPIQSETVEAIANMNAAGMSDIVSYISNGHDPEKVKVLANALIRNHKMPEDIKYLLLTNILGNPVLNTSEDLLLLMAKNKTLHASPIFHKLLVRRPDIQTLAQESALLDQGTSPRPNPGASSCPGSFKDLSKK